MIKIHKKLQNKLHKGICKYAKQIRQIQEKNKPAEAISTSLVEGLLKEAFGYNQEVLEQQENIYNKHTDISIHIKDCDIICELKRYDPKRSLLNNDAQEQLYKYCCFKKSEWGILTDGIFWEFYYYPINKKQQDGQKFAEANFKDLPQRITSKYCEQFHIFHAKVSDKNRREYIRVQNIICNENMIWCLRQEKGFKALCKTIQEKFKLPLKEINKLIPHIYDCFKEILPLPEGRNNPYDPTKDKKQQKKDNNNKDIPPAEKDTNIIS